MGKFNEIQEQTTQSYGSNSFTTTVKEDAVEFDSAKDKFKFLDPIDAPEITINGEPVVSGGLAPDENGNYNMGNDNNVTPGHNSVVIGAPSAQEVQNSVNGSNNLVVGMKNTTSSGSGANAVIGYDNTADSSTRGLISGEGNTLKGISQASIAGSSNTVEGQYSATVGSSNCNVTGAHTVVIGCTNIQYADRNNTVYVPALLNTSGTQYIAEDSGNGYLVNKKKVVIDRDIAGGNNWTIAFPMSSNQTLIMKVAYCVKTTGSPTAVTATIRQGNTNNDIANLTVDGQWHEIIVEPSDGGTQYFIHTENGVSGDTMSVITDTYANTNH